MLLIWVRLGNCRTQALLAAIERVLPQLVAAGAGHGVLEIR